MRESTPIVDRSGDALLEVFAKLAFDHGIGINITVMAMGTVISGVLVGRDTWFGELEQRSSQSSAFVRGIQEGVRAALEKPDDDLAAQSVGYYSHLHLTDAVVHAGTQTYSLGLWRGRISHISGWTLGLLQTDPPTPALADSGQRQRERMDGQAGKGTDRRTVDADELQIAADRELDAL
jgi:hypothetical protein